MDNSITRIHGETMSQGQKIAILHYAGPPGLGGVEVTIDHHARLLAAAGHHPRIVVGIGAVTSPEVEVVINPLFGSRGADIEQVNRQLAVGEVSQAYVALYERTLAALASALQGCDVVLVHNVLTLHKNLALTAALHHLHRAGMIGRLVAWCHDFAWQDPLYIAELHPGVPWDLLRQAWEGVRYVVVSQDRRQQLADLLGIPPAQIAVVTPGIDLPAFFKLEPETRVLIQQYNLLAAEPLLLLPARITRRKNIEQAIAIVGALCRLGLTPRLVITGSPGPHNPTNAAYLAELQALQQHSGATEAILFLFTCYTDEQGHPRPVSDAMMADLYHLADGLLFPSRAEGFGIPILEAGLTGLPIFCSDIAPFHETAGAAALYFDPYGDAMPIAERIAAALHADTRYSLRRRVRLAYTWEAIYQHHIAPLFAGTV